VGRRGGLRHGELRLRVHPQRPQHHRGRLPGVAEPVRHGHAPRVPGPVSNRGTAYVKRGNPKFRARWITWPTNTFCAAVAWRNYPPAEGTSATILNAVANLDRVRALKQAAHNAKIVTRHQQALAAARRQEELQAAKAGTELPGDGIADSEASKVGVPGLPSAVPVEVPQEARTPAAAVPPATPAQPAPRKPGKEDVDDARVTGLRVPATAATVTEWAGLWVRMCADGESVLGPLNDEDARSRYGLTAKQLRNVRNAAKSGALRQKAIMLGVELPPGMWTTRRAAGSMVMTWPAQRHSGATLGGRGRKLGFVPPLHFRAAVSALAVAQSGLKPRLGPPVQSSPGLAGKIVHPRQPLLLLGNREQCSFTLREERARFAHTCRSPAIRRGGR
jgi:hypothetical protein